MKLMMTAVALIALAACATIPVVDQRSIDMEREATEAMKSIPRSGLGSQALIPGECAMFLWSRTDTSKFIFFSKAISGTALLARSEGPVELLQLSADGDIFGQFNTRLSFSSAPGLNVDLEVEPGELLEGGQRIASGLLTTTNSDGWQTKLPIVGVRACQPE